MTTNRDELDKALQENLKLRHELPAKVDKGKDRSTSQRRLRLNGWQCIGILISVLWALGAWVYMNVIIAQAVQKAMTSWNEVCVEGKLSPDLLACLIKIAENERANWSGLDLIAALVPILIAWLLVYIVVWTVRWVRRGFQPASAREETPAADRLGGGRP